MLTNNANSTSKPRSAVGRLLYISLLAGLAALALVILGSPASAANPQPQSRQDHPNTPNATCPQDGQCFADVPPSSPFYTFTNNIFQQGLVTGFPCGDPGEPCDSQNRPYYRPVNNVTRQQMAKFIDNARNLPGVHIDTDQIGAAMFVRTSHDNAYSVYGFTVGRGGVGVDGEAGNDADSIGVRGISYTGTGVYAAGMTRGLYAENKRDLDGNYPGVAVYGESHGIGVGVNGYSVAGNGVVGFSGLAGTGYGVFGYSATNRAGHFIGNVDVTGNLSKGGGSFKIDDPLDPANKYLYHSFVESPDMMNVYNGNVTTDANGEATVQMPAYFDALNTDFRYQLTPIGQFAQAMVWQEIKDNQFTIKTDKPNVKVSWQVTGIRQDPYANAHRIPVEEAKPANEQDKYLYPTEEGHPASMGVDYEQEQLIKQTAQQPQNKP